MNGGADVWAEIIERPDQQATGRLPEQVYSCSFVSFISNKIEINNINGWPHPVECYLLCISFLT
jgi:hypothetical protein